MIDLGLWVCYILFIAAIAGMVIYSLVNMLRDTKKAKGTLIGVGALLGLFLICFLFSGNEVLPKYEQLGISASQSKMIGAGLIMLYILGIGTVILAVFTEFRKIFIK
jgi:hypothetical protein